ncbi:hypothetical protein HSX37_10315|uniref:Uncharacterized protein n=1 Tax=Dendrosporobacter quercicolus TaxID=146817 RepID=A0A1G9QZD1_9FIRM|nr:hypothetical protein [Dendrosporobacter quercicolus]NSL48424.1 hypothetical protein [Dendrosporobacter quercicolus DSM 1736]SDM16402.1 hypothetical protein SAMN04488502_102366 [Dendrosporobacter quercicolus]
MRLERYMLIAIVFFLIGLVAVFAGINRAPFRQMPGMDHHLHGQRLSPVVAAAACPADDGKECCAGREKTDEIS